MLSLEDETHVRDNTNRQTYVSLMETYGIALKREGLCDASINPFIPLVGYCTKPFDCFSEIYISFGKYINNPLVDYYLLSISARS